MAVNKSRSSIMISGGSGVSLDSSWGVSVVARAFVVIQCGTKEEPGRHQTDGKAGDQGGGSGVKAVAHR